MTDYHHKLEHNNNVVHLNIMGSYYSEKFARLLTVLKGGSDPQGKTALHNSSVVLRTECWSDSVNGHYLEEIPFVLAARGACKFQTGRIVDAANRSNNDLLTSCQHASGINSNTFGPASLHKGSIV